MGDGRPKVVIAGANGFIGRALVQSFCDWEVVALTRGTRGLSGVRNISWDGRSVGSWLSELNGAEAIINLAGSPISVKWSRANRKQILDSRVETAHAIASAIAACHESPKVWVNASAIGFYGDRGDEELEEGSVSGEGFLGNVCRAWEGAVLGSQRATLRRVVIRTGVVLGRGGGALPPLAKLARFGLGGHAGSGHQWVSWIHVADLCSLYRWSAANTSVSGPVNGVSPTPVQNRDLMFAIRRAVRRPWSPPVPKPALKLAGLFGAPNPDLILHSARVLPKRAQTAGFEWKFTDLDVALRDLL